MRRMLRTALAPALVLASALAACSDDDGGAVGRSPDASPPTTAAAAPARAPSTTAAARVLDGPAAVAAEIAAAEAAIRDPSTPEADLTALGRTQQRAYIALVERPEWDAEVAALVPPALRPVVEANVSAGREIKVLNGPIEEGRPLPKWRIVPPEPAAVLLAHYKAAAEATGVPWSYLAAIHLIETRMGRIQGDSVAGAQGPMQFIPSTWEAYGMGGDPQDPRDAIPAAANLLSDTGAPEDYASALHAYNPSDLYVRAVRRFARQFARERWSFHLLYAWQVYVRTDAGERRLTGPR